MHQPPSANDRYDVVIVGAGVSGASQAYALAAYSDVQRILVIEKEETAGAINSLPTNNSQTLHEGDIETNYTLEKALSVKHKASFTRVYVTQKNSEGLYLRSPKMVLGVGEKEYAFVAERYETFKKYYPGIERREKDMLEAAEQRICTGRNPNQKIIALYNPDGLTINYQRLAQSLIEDAQNSARKRGATCDVLYGVRAKNIQREKGGWTLSAGKRLVGAQFLSIAAGAHSLLFAKKMGIPDAKCISLLPVAGNFYYTPKYLSAKVYTVQNPKLPFSAVHGDPDILHGDRTRFGPTTRIVFMLERRHYNTVVDFFATLSPFFKSLIAYTRIVFDKDFFYYAFKHNVLFQVPLLGNYLFWCEAKKIIPSLKRQEVRLARGQGGVRPQIVDTRSKEPLNLGEAKLSADGVLFNITPSPGATTSVYNGLVDAQKIATALGSVYNLKALEKDFGRTLIQYIHTQRRG